MQNKLSNDTLTDFLTVAKDKINDEIIMEYLRLYYKCDEIISKIKVRKEKPNHKGS